MIEPFSVVITIKGKSLSQNEKEKMESGKILVEKFCDFHFKMLNLVRNIFGADLRFFLFCFYLFEFFFLSVCKFYFFKITRKKNYFPH